jgi:hypothetical protein
MDDAGMQVIAAASPISITTRLAIARSAIASVLLVAAGVALGWLCVGTPLVSAFIPAGRPSATQTAAGVVAWGFAIAVPAILTMLGFARIAATVETAQSLRPRMVTPRLAGALGPDHLAATELLLPGGRRIHEMVLGPFGLVVLGDVPPANLSRHVGTRWEIRGERGRWIPIEAPLDRTVRDAERVRGWLATDDRDFLVRVYAAVVTDDRRVERTPTCAVIAPDELAGWLGALPVQRGLTPERRAGLVDLIRSLAGGR